MSEMTPQAVAEYAVWYARKRKGPVAEVAAALLEECPYLREPLEATDEARLIPEGSVLVTEAELAEAMCATQFYCDGTCPDFPDFGGVAETHGYDAALIFARLRGEK